MKRTALILFALLCSVVPALAQEGPLKVQVTGYNAADFSAAEENEFEDTAIRIQLVLTNPGMGRINVTQVSGTFYNGDEEQVSQDQLEPFHIGSNESKTVYLYYANPASLYAYKVTGVINYNQGGTAYSLPILLDNTHPLEPRNLP